jgi:hypothetical protein
MNFAILYGKSTTGKIKTWKVEVIKSSEEESLIRIEHGYFDGKKQEDIRSITSGKNLGKINETTPYQQAVSEAKSDFNKKCDEGYAENIDDIKEESSGFFLPMLAHKWDTHSSKIKFPAYCQPKLDGCLSADTIVEFEDGSFEKISDVVSLKIDKKIKCFNLESGEIEFKNILNWMKNLSDINEKEVVWYEIEVESGQKLLLTGNHRVWVENLGCYRRVDELDGTESLLID